MHFFLRPVSWGSKKIWSLHVPSLGEMSGRGASPLLCQHAQSVAPCQYMHTSSAWPLKTQQLRLTTRAQKQGHCTRSDVERQTMTLS